VPDVDITLKCRRGTVARYLTDGDSVNARGERRDIQAGIRADPSGASAIDGNEVAAEIRVFPTSSHGDTKIPWKSAALDGE